jgi:hypothetical protein
MGPAEGSAERSSTMATTAAIQPDEQPIHVEGKYTDVRDEMALRKIARACIAIARRQLDREQPKEIEMNEEEHDGD